MLIGLETQKIERVLPKDVFSLETTSCLGSAEKKNRISLSTIEVEYIATSSGCTKLIWMKNMFKDYDVSREVLTLYCDNLSAINILNNPIQHSRLKHIDI